MRNFEHPLLAPALRGWRQLAAFGRCDLRCSWRGRSIARADRAGRIQPSSNSSLSLCATQIKDCASRSDVGRRDVDRLADCRQDDSNQAVRVGCRPNLGRRAAASATRASQGRRPSRSLVGTRSRTCTNPGRASLCRTSNNYGRRRRIEHLRSRRSAAPQQCHQSSRRPLL